MHKLYTNPLPSINNAAAWMVTRSSGKAGHGERARSLERLSSLWGEAETHLREERVLRSSADGAAPHPVGVLTGWSVSASVARQAGVAFVLEQPFDLDGLVLRMARKFFPGSSRQP